MKNNIIYPELSKYTNKKGSFIATVTNVRLNHCHPYINSYRDTPSMLLYNLYSIEDNEYIARYYWVNWNRSWEKANLKVGDIVEFNANSISYFTGREHHRLSVYRVTRQLYRLVYPSNIEVIGHEDIENPLEKPIINLRTVQQCDNITQYYKTEHCINSEEQELLLIALIDAENIDLLINRNGNINCTSYPPLCMYVDTYDKLTQEQQQTITQYKEVE